MAEDYPALRKQIQSSSKELAAGQPATIQAFMKLHHAALEDGALDKKTKELIALAISITSRCKGCISFHVKDALNAGAVEKEIHEAIGVAIMMGGGPAMMYAAEAQEALKQFSNNAA